MEKATLYANISRALSAGRFHLHFEKIGFKEIGVVLTQSIQGQYWVRNHVVNALIP